MAPRAYWKGSLKLSLVTCPIALYPAISAAERISFRQINRQTGNRLKQQLVDDFERIYLEGALHRSGGNIAAAARASGKPRRAFFELMRKRGVTASHNMAEDSIPAAPKDVTVRT